MTSELTLRELHAGVLAGRAARGLVGPVAAVADAIVDARGKDERRLVGAALATELCVWAGAGFAGLVAAISTVAVIVRDVRIGYHLAVIAREAGRRGQPQQQHRTQQA